MYCKKCGSEIPNDSVFCSKCGTNVETSSAQPLKQVSVIQEVTEVKNTTSDKAKKAKTSGIVLIISTIVLIISIVISVITGNVTYLAVPIGISAIVAIISFIAMIMYTRDIPVNEQTKGQKIFVNVVEWTYLIIMFILIALAITGNL